MGFFVRASIGYEMLEVHHGFDASAVKPPFSARFEVKSCYSCIVHLCIVRKVGVHYQLHFRLHGVL